MSDDTGRAVAVPIRMAAELLIHGGAPDAGARLMNEHRPDAHGRCSGCTHAGTLAPVFPCRLRLIGEVVSAQQNPSAHGERAR